MTNCIIWRNYNAVYDFSSPSAQSELVACVNIKIIHFIEIKSTCMFTPSLYMCICKLFIFVSS